MANKAHGISTKIDTEAETVTFSMLNRNGIAVVEHTVSIDSAITLLSFIVTAMDDADLLDDLDDLETDVAGHC